jgi:hypothetical protein
MAFQIIGIFSGIIWLIFFATLPFHNNKNLQNKYKMFVNFLEEQNDLETLYKIGEYNKYGQREPWGSRSYTYYNYLYEKAIKTGLEQYAEFAEFSKKTNIRSTICFLIAFFGLIIVIICYNSLI